jgi:type VI protein secretion system component VasK
MNFSTRVIVGVGVYGAVLSAYANRKRIVELEKDVEWYEARRQREQKDTTNCLNRQLETVRDLYAKRRTVQTVAGCWTRHIFC